MRCLLLTIDDFKSEPNLIKFIEYKPSVSAQELMSQGFKGKDLGDEIKRLEIEKFKQMIY